MAGCRRIGLVGLALVLASFGLAGIEAAPAVASTATWSPMQVHDSFLCCGIGPGHTPLNPGGGNRIDAVSCGSPTNCVVVAKSLDSEISGYDESVAITWDGRDWSDLESLPYLRDAGGRAQVFDVSCGSPTYCAAVGKNVQSMLVDVWDGTTWTAAEDDAAAGDGLAQVSCVSATSCVAVGSSGSDTVVQTWNGTDWATTPSNNLATGAVLADLSCISATACTAVGSLSNGTHDRTLIETWNGSTWTVVASPNQGADDNALSAIACPSSTACFAVGSYFNGTNDRTLVEQFDGSTWSIVSSPNLGGDSRLAGITCASVAHCIAVGSLVIDWNGTTWSVDANNQADNLVGAACVGSPSLCIAAGRYDDQSVTQMLVEARNVTAPAAPTAVTATPTDGGVIVHWTPPTSTGGLAISHFAVVAWDGDSPSYGVNASGSTSTTYLIGLTNGTRYRIQVSAVNAVGSSAPALSAPVVPVRTTVLATGETHACVIASPFTIPGDTDLVECWGQGTAGDLGNGSAADRTTPVLVNGITGAKGLALGGAHSCALLSDGTVKCWGANSAGQLGDGTTTNRMFPVTVTGLSSVKSISAAGSSTCAVLTNGTMKCWGQNDVGQLGDGTKTNRVHPVAVAGLAQVATTAGSGSHRCALLTTHAIKCWGRNSFGQLGDGTTTDRVAPKAITSLGTTVLMIAARGTHTCALVTGAKVKCWGRNDHGQVGDGSSFDHRTTPTNVSSLTNVTLIGGGADTTCARLSSGATKCWGRGDAGQIGDGKFLDRRSPVANHMVSPPVALEGGTTYTAARNTAGGIRTWGQNNMGQLGSGNTTTRPTPGAVSGLG